MWLSLELLINLFVKEAELIPTPPIDDRPDVDNTDLHKTIQNITKGSKVNIYYQTNISLMQLLTLYVSNNIKIDIIM